MTIEQTNTLLTASYRTPTDHELRSQHFNYDLYARIKAYHQINGSPSPMDYLRALARTRKYIRTIKP